jgi:hypothetical protein
MVIAFMEVGGRLFYVWDTYHDLIPNPDTSEPVETQPETAPVLEVNPADNGMPVEQADSGESETIEIEYTEPEYTETETPATDELPAFEDYTEEMKAAMLRYDVFDVGLSEAMDAYADEPYKQWDNAAAYLGWWAGQEFGTELSGEEVKAIYEATEDKNQLIISECIAEYFGKQMYMDQEGNMYVGDGDIEDPDGSW